MTSPKCSLHPASGNDRGALLRALEFVACARVQLAQIVWTVIGQGVSLEPGPQIFDRIEVGGIGRKKGNPDVPVQRVEVVAHQMAAMRLQAIPDHQQGLLEMRLLRFEEFDDFLLFDTSLVQPEQEVGAAQPGNDRDMVPVEVKLDDGCFALQSPSTHPGWALADAGLVDKDDQPAFSPGFF